MGSFTEKFVSNIAKLGKQAVNSVAKIVDRVANRSEFEAVIAAIVLVASSDGSSSSEERNAGLKLVITHPALNAFAPEEVAELYTEYHALLGLDRTVGVEQLVGKVRKITDVAARSKIISIAEAIANADGTFSAEEKAVIERLKGVVG